MRAIQVVDSHTGGEPTRVVLSGGPDLGRGPLRERLERFLLDHDRFRSAIVNEPRGSDVLVGALLVEPVDPAAATGVLFFNNVGGLGMCGHGAIGVVTTLAFLGRIAPGSHRIETPVGTVAADLHASGEVTIGNVASRRHRRAVRIDVPGLGAVTGDVAWGGNWFFLVADHDERLHLDNVERLTDVTRRIRRALREAGVTGEGGAEIDHVELFGPPSRPDADSRNFVLCPGHAYDRSPCGTGTSAKVACLAEDGALAEGAAWRQESILGSVFTARYRRSDGAILPSITGAAHVTARAELLLDEGDPFRWGISR